MISRACLLVQLQPNVPSKGNYMSPELEELLHSTFILRQILSTTTLSKEAVDYIMELVAKDRAHHKYLKLIEEEN